MPEESIRTRLESVVALLQRHDVEFLLIGGMAEALFGSPRPTYDIDICYRRTPAKLREARRRAQGSLGDAARGARRRAVPSRRQDAGDGLQLHL